MFKKYILVSFLALALVVGVGAGTANAALTLEALAITSDGALALNSTDWDISATGVVTGVGAVTMDGTLTLANGETIANAVDGVLAVTSPSTTFSGDITITGDDLVMGTNTSGAVLVADGTNFNPAVMSGDATIGTTGVLAIASNAVQGTDISLASEVAGDIMYSNGTDWVRLAKGTALQVLRTNAGATAPEWATMVASLDNASAWTASQALDAGITVDTDNFIVNGTTGAVTAEAGITLSGATGVNEIVLPTNLADALSIEDSAGDLMVFDTTTGTQVLTITPATTIAGALILSGGTGASNALATIGTLVTDAGVDVSANVGRLTGLQINLLNSGATVTGFRAIDARVTDNGTAANAVAVQGLTTKASGVSTGEAWTGNFILTMTGGKYEDVFGVSSDVVIGATSSVGSASSPAVNNLVAGRFSSYVDTSATLSAVVLDVPILSVLNGGANDRAKADAAVMAMIDGGSAGTVTAESAFAVRDYGDVGAGDEFDYGLNLYFNSAPFANTFAQSDIRVSSGAKIFTGSAANGDAVYAEVGAKDATGSLYITTAGKLYVQVANAGAATDWELVTTTDAD